MTQSRPFMPTNPLPKTGHSFMRVAARFETFGPPLGTTWIGDFAAWQLFGIEVLKNASSRANLMSVAIRPAKVIDMSSFCLASSVAPTTTLRYVDLLADNGYVAREDDANDGRCAFVETKYKLMTATEAWLGHAADGLITAGLVSTPLATPDEPRKP